MADDRVRLDAIEALAMLPEGEKIHTFRSSVGVMLGCDWSRASIEDAIRKYGAELSGPAATAMKHGLALHDERGWLFIATRGEREGESR